MREIRFRGKRLDTGEWVYGDLIQHDNNKFCIKCAPGILGVLAVDPATVGQYTGLKDKNGVEVYEGDIVTTTCSRPYAIVDFANGGSILRCHDDGKDYIDRLGTLDEKSSVLHDSEYVIGNIHDNPELLEENS